LILHCKYISLLIIVFLYAIDTYAQSEYTIPLPDNIVAIDIISIDDDYIHIVSQNGIYEINGSSISDYLTFDDMDITHNLSETHLSYLNDKHHSYPILQGGYISIINKDSIVRSHANDLLYKSTSAQKDKSNKVSTLINQHEIKAVIKTYESLDSSIKILTKEKLYTLSNNALSVDYKVNDDTTEELISLHVDGNNNTWILSNQRVIALTPKYLHHYDLPKANRTYQLYKIRDRVYCSNGLQVMQKFNDTWQVRPGLRAPQNVIIDSIGNPYLVYKNNAEKLSKINARLLGRTDNFHGELIEDINSIYVCTSKSVYKNNVTINNSTDHYYKSITENGNVIIIGQSGIYTYTNNNFELLKSANILKSKNYFLEDGHIFYFTDNTINHVEVEQPGNEGTLALSKSKILDFISIHNQLIILTSRSVLYLDKKALLRDIIKINKAIPLSPHLADATLNNIDGNIWISTCENLSLINDNLAAGLHPPTLSLMGKANQNNITTTLKSNNFYSENINYTYYINSPKGTKTIWTKDPNINIDQDLNSDVNIIAKMSDDVFAQDIYSNGITINATKSPIIDILIKIIAAILATLLILWAIRKWITA